MQVSALWHLGKIAGKPIQSEFMASIQIYVALMGFDLLDLLRPQSESDGQARLRVKVDNQDALAFGNEGIGQIDRRGGFADSAFLVCNCDHSWAHMIKSYTIVGYIVLTLSQECSQVDGKVVVKDHAEPRL